MRGPNLSEWSLRHPSLIVFAILLLSFAGVLSYLRLGRAEDPDFTIKTMVVSTAWPGATAREVELQVTDEIEKKLQETPWLESLVSYSRPGESVVRVNLRQDTPSSAVADVWYQVRKKTGDVRNRLPQGVQGPFFNDEFGDTFGIIYAFSGDGWSMPELKRVAEDVRGRLLRVKDVGKIELYGTQDPKIFVEFSHTFLANTGIQPQQIFDGLAREYAVTGTGRIDTATDRVAIRIDGTPDKAEAVRQVPILVNGRLVRVGDVAEVRLGTEDPAVFTMRFNGKPVVGLGLSMAKGGNILEVGGAVAAEMERIARALPVGIEVEQVADQPHVVSGSIEEFVISLAEALAIVLAVSLISLGLRTGIVVALSVPLVLAITFLLMEVMGINLHRISLGALIIALGLLVDDAIIAVEMMMVKLEQGWDRMKAASFAYTSTAFPMLTGTLVTAAGFVPVGFAKSAAGEYTNAIFWVVFLSLMVSWVVAVLFTPFIGYHLLPKPKPHAGGTHHDIYDTRIYRAIRATVGWCVRWRKSVIAVTAATFALALYGFGFVQQQFFPSSSRPELMIDLRLAEGSSFQATERAVKRMEAWLAEQAEVEHFVAYTGAGTPRFYLPLNPELRNAGFGQFVVMTKGLEARERLLERLRERFGAGEPDLRGRVTRLENGPPVGFPVQFRVIGDDPATIRRIADEVRTVMRANPDTRDVHFEWDELSKAVRLEVDQAKARALGVNNQDLARTLATLMSGTVVTQIKAGTELVDVIARAVPEERLSLERIGDVNIGTARGTTVPLSQVATIRHVLEEPVLWRRDGRTMMTVRSDIVDGVQAPVVSTAVDRALEPLRARLPDGYRIDMGGAIEESVKSQSSIFAVMPLMVLIMLTVLMVQLQSFARLVIVFLTAPLGMIGVSAALLVSGLPFGFVAMLGVIALAGMIMRNSVILVDQIEQDIRDGHTPYEAIVGAAVRRARPIFLTAAAAILAMVPLVPSVFWGPMAVAIMGGLAVATLLTLLFLPALYAAWFRVAVPARPGRATAGLPAGMVPTPAE